jgi:hypothetical protein
MVKESAIEVTDGKIWGVRSGCVGVMGTGRRSWRGFLRVSGWGVRAEAVVVVVSGSFLTGVKPCGVGGSGSRAITWDGGSSRGL